MFCFQGSYICVSVFHLFLWPQNIPLYGYTTLSIPQLMDIGLFPLFWLLWIVLLWTFVYNFFCDVRFHLLAINPGKWNCCHMVTQYLTFWRTATSSTVLFYIPINDLCRLQFFPLFANTCYHVSSYFSHPRETWHGIFSHSGFDLHFWSLMMSSNFFRASISHWPIFGEMPIQILWSLFKTGLCLCIIKVTWEANGAEEWQDLI